MIDQEKVKAQRKRYQQKYKDKLAIYQMLLYWSDREKHIARQTKWNKEHKVQLNIYRRKRYAENPEVRQKNLDTAKKFNLTNPTYRREYYLKNKKHHLDNCKRWQREHRERMKDINEKSRMKYRDVYNIYSQLWRLSKKI